MKWCLTVFGIVFGTFWLEPWVNGKVNLSKALGLDALVDPVYMSHRQMVRYWGNFQLATLIFALFISVLKPWKKRLSKINYCAERPRYPYTEIFNGKNSDIGWNSS